MVARSDASTIDTGSSATISRRSQQQRARHHDALPLTAGELVRIAAEDFLGPQADGAQCLLDQPRVLPRASPRGGTLRTGVVSTWSTR